MNHDGIIQYNELVGGDYAPEVSTTVDSVDAFNQSAVGIFNHTNSVYSEYRSMAISTAISNEEFVPPVFITYISLIFICIAGIMLFYNLFQLSFKILGHMLLSPYGAALTPIDGGKKFAEWRGHLFTDFAQLILYTLLFAVFLLVFASLDVLTDDFFDFLSDHSSILDRPPFGLDPSTVEGLISSFYRVGIIIGSVFAIETLPALFGGILGQINALSGGRMMRKGMKLAAGITPLTAAAGAAVEGISKVAKGGAKAASSGVKRKLGEQITKHKYSESTVSKRNAKAAATYRAMNQSARIQNNKKASVVDNMFKSKNISLTNGNSGMKTHEEFEQLFAKHGVPKSSQKAFFKELDSGHRDANSNGAFNEVLSNAELKNTPEVQEPQSKAKTESNKRLTKNEKERKKLDPTLK